MLEFANLANLKFRCLARQVHWSAMCKKNTITSLVWRLHVSSLGTFPDFIAMCTVQAQDWLYRAVHQLYHSGQRTFEACLRSFVTRKFALQGKRPFEACLRRLCHAQDYSLGAKKKAATVQKRQCHLLKLILCHLY